MSRGLCFALALRDSIAVVGGDAGAAFSHPQTYVGTLLMSCYKENMWTSHVFLSVQPFCGAGNTEKSF